MEAGRQGVSKEVEGEVKWQLLLGSQQQSLVGEGMQYQTY